MKTPAKIAIVALVAFAAIAAFALKNKTASDRHTSNAAAPGAPSRGTEQVGAPLDAKLPRLLDLGADKCVPCKMMKPILDDLKKNYSHAFITEFIDVWENRDDGRKYGIEAIPTQIFFDADGKELFRHTGFYGKEDILGKWKELGADLDNKPKNTR